jgi:AraC-like DNA-binding protein/xanthosine utilization system XapX-like protein
LFEFVLRGIAIGSLAATGIGLYRSGTTLAVRVAGVVFVASIIAYAFNSSWVLRQALGPLAFPIHFLSLAGVGYLWLFIVTLFEDRPLSWTSWGPAAVLTAVGLFGVFLGRPIQNYVWVLHNGIELAVAVHALSVIVTSWRGDLVEERRRLRGPFLTLVVLLTMVFSAVEIGESLGVQASWYPLIGAAALAVFCLAGNFMFLLARPDLFGTAQPAPVPAPDPGLEAAATHLELARLAAVMTAGAWRDETLTIASLAAQIGLPEHRLRRLINDQLGHRNFAAFLNAHRIDAAKAMLADPAKARTTVAAIAFDLGYGSLGPFNRAFKEATGMTPTEWRRGAQPDPSPNPENPGRI